MTPKVDEIKDAIRACRSVLEVDECARTYAKDMAALWKEGGKMRTMVIQIRNLAAYKRAALPRFSPKS